MAAADEKDLDYLGEPIVRPGTVFADYVVGQYATVISVFGEAEDMADGQIVTIWNIEDDDGTTGRIDERTIMNWIWNLLNYNKQPVLGEDTSDSLMPSPDWVRFGGSGVEGTLSQFNF